MIDPDTLSIEDWKSLFRTLSTPELLHLQAVIDRIEAGQSMSPEDRRAIVAMFGRPVGDSAAA